MSYRVAFESANLLRMWLVTLAAMLAICLLALVGTTNTVEATSLPENGKIAFARQPNDAGGIYTVDPDGSGLSLLAKEGDEPAWSPDGTKIAYTTNVGIKVMDADGSNKRRLTPNRPDLFYSDPTWSSDGTQLAFTTQMEHYDLDSRDIYTMDVDGSNITNIIRSPGVGEADIDISPDGSQMCLERFRSLLSDIPGEGQSESGIYVVNIDGSNPTRLSLTDWTEHECAWSPDGTKIAYSYTPPGSPGDGESPPDVYIMNADGSGKINLTKNRAWGSHPAWSPDGTKIAFMSDRDSGDAGNGSTETYADIYTMDADGSDVVRVTETPLVYKGQPDWQPLTPKSRSMTVHPPDTGGPSLLWVASALLFSGGVMFYAGVKPRL